MSFFSAAFGDIDARTGHDRRVVELAIQLLRPQFLAGGHVPADGAARIEQGMDTVLPIIETAPPATMQHKHIRHVQHINHPNSVHHGKILIPP
jgi:hypothetical protein